MNQLAIRCIDLKFNEARLQDWVEQLTVTDKRVEGCKDFEWNDTVTAGEKRANRQKKINEAKNKKIYAEEKKRKHDEWVKRMEEKQIYLVKVSTEDMPADFLTKFVGKAKLAKSLQRATNSSVALPPKKA